MVCVGHRTKCGPWDQTQVIRLDSIFSLEQFVFGDRLATDSSVFEEDLEQEEFVSTVPNITGVSSPESFTLISFICVLRLSVFWVLLPKVFCGTFHYKNENQIWYDFLQEGRERGTFRAKLSLFTCFQEFGWWVGCSCFLDVT